MLIRGFVIGLLVSQWACGSSPAPQAAAAEAPVPAATPKQHKVWPVLLEVAARVPVHGGESEVREGLADALDGASFDGVANRRFVLSASLSELDRGTNGSTATTSCSIDLAVTESGSGKLLGTVKGHARVESSLRDSDAETDALRAAAKEAVGSALTVAKQAH